MSENQAHKRVIQGKVISKAGHKSVVILVERRVVHAKYRKIVKRFKKYTIHDEEQNAKIGDVVSAIECRPISKTKAFKLREIVVSGVEL